MNQKSSQEEKVSSDVTAGQKIVEILHAIKNATEASTRELAAIRQLLETNTFHQRQSVRATQPPTQCWQDNDNAKQLGEAGKSEEIQGSTPSGYAAYREKQKPQTPGVIRFVKPEHTL